MTKNNLPIKVNILGGPGIGKSTVATGVFALLKMHEVDAEYISEFAKDLTWEKSLYSLRDQYYVWAVQNHSVWRLIPYVDVIITDSPTIMSLVYGEHTMDEFKQVVLKMFNSYNNINFLLKRITEYVPTGRNQDLQEACIIDEKIENSLIDNEIEYITTDCNHDSINDVVSIILSMLGKKHTFKIRKE